MNSTICNTQKEIDAFIGSLKLQVNIIGDDKDNFYFTTLNPDLLSYADCLKNKIKIENDRFTFFDLKSKKFYELPYNKVCYNIFVSLSPGFTPAKNDLNEILSNSKIIIDRLKKLSYNKTSSQRNPRTENLIVDAIRGNLNLKLPIEINFDRLDLLILSYDSAVAEETYLKNKHLIDSLSTPITNILYHFDKEVQINILNEQDKAKQFELLKACWITVLENGRENFIRATTKKIAEIADNDTDSKFLKSSLKSEIDAIKKLDFIQELALFSDAKDLFFYWPFNNFNLETEHYILTKKPDLDTDGLVQVKINSDSRLEYTSYNDYLIRLLKAIKTYSPDLMFRTDDIKDLFEVNELNEEQEKIKKDIFNNKIKMLEKRKLEIFDFLDNENDLSDTNILKDITELKELINSAIKSFTDSYNENSVLEIITYWPAALQPAPDNLSF